MAKEGISYKTDSNGNLKVFNVERNEDVRNLNGNYANPENRYDGEVVWLFACKCVYFSRFCGSFC